MVKGQWRMRSCIKLMRGSLPGLSIPAYCRGGGESRLDTTPTPLLDTTPAVPAQKPGAGKSERTAKRKPQLLQSVVEEDAQRGGEGREGEGSERGGH
jgi:hypothetical protein